MSTAIRVEHLSKEYRLGIINHGMLYKDMQTWLARRFGKPDPHSKIGTDRFSDEADRFWALKDICFDVEQGDRLALIGRNGAGKSTLLKILSRITAPTEGSLMARGRITSLLEVGTGFHPELTGRDNVFLNGAILGMKRREVEKKFDEIVAFSEIEKFIDTPVKRYSSGMYVRLAFAVAAHLDSEILLADEVLAVGDASFQKKCLGKMEDVSKNQGRTVVFVSHNIAAVKKLCTRGILLDKGQVLFSGSIDETAQAYATVQRPRLAIDFEDESIAPGNDQARLKSARIWAEGEQLDITKPIQMEFEVWHHEANCVLNFSMHLIGPDGQVVFNTWSEPIAARPGVLKGGLAIPANLLNDTNYSVLLILVKNQNRSIAEWNDILVFQAEEPDRDSTWFGKVRGDVRPKLEWQLSMEGA